jgi:hypothetical protein
VADAEQVNGALQRNCALPPAPVASVIEIAGHVQVFEQADLLEHVTDRPPVRGARKSPSCQVTPPTRAPSA